MRLFWHSKTPSVILYVSLLCWIKHFTTRYKLCGSECLSLLSGCDYLHNSLLHLLRFKIDFWKLFNFHLANTVLNPQKLSSNFQPKSVIANFYFIFPHCPLFDTPPHLSSLCSKLLSYLYLFYYILTFLASTGRNYLQSQCSSFFWQVTIDNAGTLLC